MEDVLFKRAEAIEEVKMKLDVFADIMINGYMTMMERVPSFTTSILVMPDGKRVLLYSQRTQKTAEITDKWSGDKYTIKKAKGSTIKCDVVIMGVSLNKKNLYTAITRTTQIAYSTINKVND